MLHSLPVANRKRSLPTKQRGRRLPQSVLYLPAIRRKRSKLHGWGVFAAEPINKNKRVITYDGEKIRNRDSTKREIRYLKLGRIWCFRVNHLYSRDANVGGNIARFINHACKPNCYSNIFGDTIWICAARNISPGEELTYNYYTEGEGEIPCKCQPGCKNLL